MKAKPDAISTGVQECDATRMMHALQSVNNNFLNSTFYIPLVISTLTNYIFRNRYQQRRTHDRL